MSTSVAECRRALDVAFLLDCSDADADQDAWNSTLNFIDAAVSRIHPRSGGTHVALVLFDRDQTAVVVRKLDHQPLHVVLRNLSGTCSGPRDSSKSLLRTLRQSVFSNTEGDRPEVADILLVVVGRAAADVDGVEAAAASLIADGIRIVSVALGTSERVLHQLLRLTSSDDDAQRRLVVARAEHYRVLLPTLTDVLCRSLDTGQWLVIRVNVIVVM